ncbi:MAG: sigma-70 family RNA polymerase sigma factor [Blastocatellales bacterium]
MSIPEPEPVTDLLRAWSAGDEEALERLTPLVYDALHKIAKNALRRERRDHTLQATTVVNEAFLRLVDQKQVDWRSRNHFFAVAAKLMRRILVDYARKHHAGKRGGQAVRLSLDDVEAPVEERAASLVALDDALAALEKTDPRKARVVELRFFGGLTIEETADALGVHTATVARDWELAKAWLYRELSREE